MKKILGIIIAFLSIIIIPNTVNAASYQFNYYCDSKQPVGDGTFTMTCHLGLNSNMEINHVKGSLILKNVTLKSISTNSDWTSLHGLSKDVEFTSSTVHSGTFNVADFVFTGNLSDTECEASFLAELAEKTQQPDPTPQQPEQPKTCAIVNGTYYGASGTIVTEEKYYEECCKYTCTVINNKYYFDSHGKSVSYDAMMKDCSTIIPEGPKTGIDYGYIILPLGIISIIAINKFKKKNQKIYKI